MPPPERILVTGCSGFVGRHLVPLCHARYPFAELVGISHQDAVLEAPDARFIHLHADLRERARMRELIADIRPDVVIHLAGLASVAESWKQPQDALEINAVGAINLLEAVHAAELRPRILLIGSAEQYGVVAPEDNPVREDRAMLPMNPYAVSKAAQDMLGFQYFASYGLPILRVRAFNHFGPYQSPAYVVSGFARQLALIESGRLDPVIRVGNLTSQRDFLPVRDVVRAYLALTELGHPGEAYNVGSGVPMEIGHLLESLMSLSSKHIEVRVDSERLRPADVPVIYADISHIRQDTGWQPSYSVEDALLEVLEYWRGQVHRESAGG